MNLFAEYHKKFLILLKEIQKKNLLIIPDKFNNFTVELPPKDQLADISTNIAMLLAKHNRKNPIDLANLLKKDFINNFEEFEKIEIAKPGFINIKFRTDFWREYIIKIVKFNKKFGSNLNLCKKFNIEFVSANPTGPLHVGHCRGAIIGDVLSNLLKFNGHNVTKEYYVNDYGNQIKSFVDSVYHRILEIKEKKPFPIDQNLYPGEYIIDIAKKIIKKNITLDYKLKENIYEILEKNSLNFSIEMIKANLASIGVVHDKFIYESSLIKNNEVEKTVKNLTDKNFVYKGKLSPPKGDLIKDWKPREQLLFKSTSFGDDTDRALQKEDNSWTYFAGDLAYHSNKINRNYDFLINILGADHAGYIKRIVSGVKALSNDKTKLICKVSQLVKLFKNGQPFKMSKRKGDYVTVEDLVNEVGRDSVRFIMLNRSNDVELDFDFEKVAEKSKDNPVFYVQYAYARINSVFMIADMDIENDLTLNIKDIVLNEHEVEILKKISEWPKCVELAVNKLEPHRIPYYLYDLSTLFHSYWNLGNANKDLRFVHSVLNIKNSRLLLLKALSIVIKNGMTILGVSTPKSM
jgi:arginyl-tRNA synthetase